jgi:hypothetical protein
MALTTSSGSLGTRGLLGALALGALVVGAVVLAEQSSEVAAPETTTPAVSSSLMEVSAAPKPPAPPAPELAAPARTPDDGAMTPEALEPMEPAPPFEEDEEVHAAIAKGLRYLARSQSPKGGWIQDIGYKFNDNYHITASAKPDVGVSSLALMAFLSGGYLPGRGQYGKVVERGTDFVLSCVDPESGYISANYSRMYSHAFATLFLAEIFGMTHRADVRQKLQLAVNLTVDAQNIHGSWRYEPNSPDSDMSITVCQIMALRAARNIGIKVPKTTIDRAYDYVIRSAITGGRDRGGFKYQEKDGTRTSYSLTAAGVATLHNTGTYDHALIKSGIEYLKKEFDALALHYEGHYFFWYGNYYASQVFFTASDSGTDNWNNFYWRRIRSHLLRTQKDNGSWKNTVGPGDAFSTAVATIILQIPYQYLPIFQR